MSMAGLTGRIIRVNGEVDEKGDLGDNPGLIKVLFKISNVLGVIVF
jgi:hypothetical protein